MQETRRSSLWSLGVAAAASSALATLGCVHTDHLLIDPDACRHQGVPVEILSEPPASPHVRLAVVEAAQWRWMVPAEWEYLRLGLCREAHELGADAIVHPTMDPQSYSWNVGPLGHSGSTRKLVAVAIRYTGPAPSASTDESD